ncbi:MAG: YggS family pyridoxal phosphate-dependent enzyme [Idiomarina sp.]|nr:YggS family pyridoxal phosphate-dependent enzyme [Idiomarina sp.]
MTIADSNAPDDSRQGQIEQAIRQVTALIGKACDASERSPQQVRLLAVSKTKPESDIRAAYQAGQREFGENYVQEGVSKVQAMTDLADITWHFIGPLQSNKTKDVAQNFAWMHSLDRLKIARRLNDQRMKGQPPLQVLIQVNIDDEHSKAGINLTEVASFAAALQAFDQLTLRGLMAIPRADATPEQQAQSYGAFQQAFGNLQASYPQVDTLSLGMSNDLDAAIQHGSTMVRIGTAIFGKRDT